jgi:hypothetical protein
VADRYVFADEAGNFDFSRGSGASRYFILCTVASSHCEVADSLLALRRDLGWRGTKKARGALHTAVDDVVRQLSPCRSHRVAFWPADSDPCLQVADYCTWAIQRKWERADERSHTLISPKIRSEFDVWQRGVINYY